MTKKCFWCKKEKHVSEFRKCKRNKDEYSGKCRECIKLYDLEWYSKNRKKRSGQIQKKNQEAIKRNRDYTTTYLSESGCCVCGIRDPDILDFHHKYGKKENNISVMVRNACSIAKIKKEIEKCVVICSNHHRKLHAEHRKRV